MGRRVLLGVSGSIAAYKAAVLARDLMKAGWSVQAVLTEGAKQFVQPLTFSALTGRDALTEWVDGDGKIQHVEQAHDVDLLLIAPASANLIARLASGMADDLLTAIALSTQAPIMIAPAMETGMYNHAATQDNLQKLRDRGVMILEPEEGALASGRSGTGRMREPADICSSVQRVFEDGPWKGRRVVVTAGPTWEPLDPVRILSNRSTGRMGIEVADAAARKGAQVSLLLGPTHLRPREAGVEVLAVETAEEMLAAGRMCFSTGPVDVLIGVAAVSDYRVANPKDSKLKRSDPAAQELKLVENPDVLATLSSERTSKCTVVGFAAETENEEANARKKLDKKGCDLVIANLVGKGHGFGPKDTSVLAVTADDAVPFGPADKRSVADFVIEQVVRAESKS